MITVQHRVPTAINPELACFLIKPPAKFARNWLALLNKCGAPATKLRGGEAPQNQKRRTVNGTIFGNRYRPGPAFRSITVYCRGQVENFFSAPALIVARIFRQPS